MSKQLNYIPKLDSLRTIAAFMVVVSHYVEELKLGHFSYGANGVPIFFVISGFLITSILLAQKNKLDKSLWELFKNFIIKRALRLFPIYYLMIIILFGLSTFFGLWICDMGDEWYYFTYTQNWLFLFKGWQSPLINHSWSLAVEEQFYLFWPLILLSIPKKHELKLILVLMFTGIVVRYWLTLTYTGIGTIKGVTFSNFDTLGSGALLAYFIHYKVERVEFFLETYNKYLIVLTLVSTLLLTYLDIYNGLILPQLMNIMAVCLVYTCFESVHNFITPVLNLKFMQNIGKISYGIYLYHKPIPTFFGLLTSKLNIPIPSNKYILFMIYLLVTYIVASISWKIIESPIGKLKNKFDL